MQFEDNTETATCWRPRGCVFAVIGNAAALSAAAERELTTLKRILNLARQHGTLMHVPHVPMLKERNVRTGFFEREQIERIRAHLPPPIRPAVQFACITGWRIPSEVLNTT